MDKSKKSQDLEQFFSLLAEGKEDQFFSKDTLAYAQFLSGETPIDDKKEITEHAPIKEAEIKPAPAPIKEEVKVEKEQIVQEPVKLMDEINKYLKKSSKGSIAVPPPPNDVRGEIFGINKKLEHLENWAYRLSVQSPGSGEVWFRRLNDVVSDTMETGNDNWVLEYDAATRKVKFTEDIGPIQTVKFNTSHVHDEVRVPGTLCWSADDRTMNIAHPNDVIQQVGQETYFLVKNNTGSTITNGTCVRFAGASNGGDTQARLLVAPWLANGQFLSLYAVGIATEDIPNGAEGLVTNFGKLRDLNTTGASVNETWQLGDILYAHPTIVGGLTRVKPTAPNNVVPMAAVLKVSATEGEIFVRPTIYPPLYYGTFADTTNQTHTSIETPKAITFNRTEVANGHSRGTDTSRIIAAESGLYNYKFSLQLVSSNSAAKEVWIWFRRNGVDIPDSTTRKTIVGNSVYDVAAWDISLSMNANDYFQIMWAVSDTAVSIVAPAATAFAPAIPSVLLTVSQIAV